MWKALCAVGGRGCSGPLRWIQRASHHPWRPLPPPSTGCWPQPEQAVRWTWLVPLDLSNHLKTSIDNEGCDAGGWVGGCILTEYVLLMPYSHSVNLLTTGHKDAHIYALYRLVYDRQHEEVSLHAWATLWLIWVIDALRCGMPTLVAEVCEWCRVVFSRTGCLTRDMSLLILRRSSRNTS